MKESFFNGLYYRANTFESGRPTVVFVHGLSGSSSAWLPYEKILENKYNILSMDLRGHGKSFKSGKYEDYLIGNFVTDLHNLVDQLQIKNFVFVSHSFATLIVLEYLLKFKGEAKASVFLSPSFNVGKSLSSKILKPFLALSPIFSVIPFTKKNGRHIDYTKHKNTGDWNIPRMIADVGNTTFRVYVYCTRQSYTVDMENFLEHIDIPTLLIHGKKDSIFPVKNSMVMAKKIKNSKLILIPHADHIIALNNVSEITQEIESFIEDNKKFLISNI